MSSSANDSLLLLTGQLGAILIKDTTSRTGEWRRISALADTVIATIKLNGVVYSAISVTAGAEIYGIITELTLTSGTIALYK